VRRRGFRVRLERARRLASGVVVVWLAPAGVRLRRTGIRVRAKRAGRLALAAPWPAPTPIAEARQSAWAAAAVRASAVAAAVAVGAAPEGARTRIPGIPATSRSAPGEARRRWASGKGAAGEADKKYRGQSASRDPRRLKFRHRRQPQRACRSPPAWNLSEVCQTKQNTRRGETLKRFDSPDLVFRNSTRKSQ
jgi:hypothetical protein